MKTIKFFGMMLMAMILAFGVTACGSDDDEGGSYVGTWVTYADGDINSGRAEIGILTLTSNTWMMINYEVNGDNVYKHVNSGNMKVSGNRIEVYGVDDFNDATWSVSNNVLTFSYVNERGKSKTEKYTRITSEQQRLINELDKLAQSYK